MIVFHEGLPGSGKSYEALVMHIIPALQNGRDVLTNINGINYEKIAELTELPVRVVKMLLVSINHPDTEDEEVRLERVRASILSETKKDSLVVIDEIQDIHPTGRQKLSGEWSKYIASHRHEGLDIVLMGQDRRDVHPMWRRRVQRLITFNKLSAVGAEKSYRWEVYEATRPEKFKRVTSGVRKYEKRYFGSYASHTQGTTNTDLYKDDRANILKNKNLRLVLFAIPVVLYFAIDHLNSFFSPEVSATEPAPDRDNSPSLAPPPAPPAPEPPPAAPQRPAQPATPQEPSEPPPLDVFDEYARKNRLRLTGYIVNDTTGEFYARIDILNSSGHRLDEYTVVQLKDMGWQVTLRESGLHLVKEDREHLARPWPLDTVRGRVDRTTTQSLSGRY